jgi:hypothetical protein
LFLRHKCKAELAGLTPVKTLRSSATVIMWTTADDATWVVECRAATERL